MNFRSLSFWLAFFLVLFQLVSCQPFKEYIAQPIGKFFDWDTEVNIQFHIESDVNPDIENRDRPSPIVVRIYELMSPESFEQAEFRDIYFNDKEVLGEDFVKKHALKAFLPGTSRRDHFFLKRGTTHIGLFAEFSDYKDAKYRVVLPVDEYLTTTQNVKLFHKSMILLKREPRDRATLLHND